MYEYQPVCIGTALMYVHVLIEVGVPMGGAPYKYVKEEGVGALSVVSYLSSMCMKLS